MDFVGMYDESFLRGPPYNRFMAEGEIGEYAHGIGLGQPFGRNFPSYGVEAGGVAIAWVREFGGMVKLEYHMADPSLRSG